MRTTRQLKIDRAVLHALALIPEGYLAPQSLLHGDAARLVLPRPSTAELDEAVAHADASHRIVGVHGEEGVKWKISDAGRAWLAEHP